MERQRDLNAYAFGTATNCCQLHSAETGPYAHRTLSRPSFRATRWRGMLLGAFIRSGSFNERQGVLTATILTFCEGEPLFQAVSSSPHSAPSETPARMGPARRGGGGMPSGLVGRVLRRLRAAHGGREWTTRGTRPEARDDGFTRSAA